MNGFTIYFLTDQSKLYSTYADRTLVIGTRDVEQIYKLRKMLMSHRLKYDRWINRYVSRTYTDEYSAELKITTNSHKANLTYLSVLPINFNDQDKLNKNAFVFRHCDIFIADEIEYDRVSDILSLQEICIDTDNIFEKDFDDHCEYLDSCWGAK